MIKNNLGSAHKKKTKKNKTNETKQQLIITGGLKKIQVKFKFHDIHMPIKVGVANIHWVTCILVSNIPTHL